MPAGKEYERPAAGASPGAAPGSGAARPPMPAAAPAADGCPGAASRRWWRGAADAAGGLAEVQRVRQFFPETWIWDDLTTDAAGKAQQDVRRRRTASPPGCCARWRSPRQTGLGIAEAQLRVFQPFFVTVDLPYSAIRGEEFPVKVALYNYLDTHRGVHGGAGAGRLVRPAGRARPRRSRSRPNDVGGAEFTIQPDAARHATGEGHRPLAQAAADAIVKELIVEPEGVARESRGEPRALARASSRQLDLAVPDVIVEGSARAYVALTGSYLTQTIEGLEKLLQMPFGCGEQNMILFAPNVFVSRYLKETGQLKPEIMAKAETLMITGYQRELTYRRNDGSFSAFGEQDEDGSLWLTAFVLKTFAQAKDLIFVDDAVLATRPAWIAKHQKADGSFEPVGFVHHQELLGGLQGKTALTAYVAVALREAGEQDAVGKAIRYLEGALDAADDAYALALGTYALELAKSAKAEDAYDKLMKLAKESDEGLSWGDDAADARRPDAAAPGIRPAPAPRHRSAVRPVPPRPQPERRHRDDRLRAPWPWSSTATG